MKIDSGKIEHLAKIFLTADKLSLDDTMAEMYKILEGKEVDTTKRIPLAVAYYINEELFAECKRMTSIEYEDLRRYMNYPDYNCRLSVASQDYLTLCKALSISIDYLRSYKELDIDDMDFVLTRLFRDNCSHRSEKLMTLVYGVCYRGERYYDKQAVAKDIYDYREKIIANIQECCTEIVNMEDVHDEKFSEFTWKMRIYSEILLLCNLSIPNYISRQKCVKRKEN